jgi:hypothetical protein
MTTRFSLFPCHACYSPPLWPAQDSPKAVTVQMVAAATEVSADSEMRVGEIGTVGSPYTPTRPPRTFPALMTTTSGVQLPPVIGI